MHLCPKAQKYNCEKSEAKKISFEAKSLNHGTKRCSKILTSLWLVEFRKNLDVICVFEGSQDYDFHAVLQYNNNHKISVHFVDELKTN